jgi:dynamin GTPase/dynamin 1-like protein
MIRNLTVAYFDLVKKTVADAVPKAVRCFLIDKFVSGLAAEITKSLYTDHTFDTLMKESDETVETRRRAEEMLRLLQQAQAVMAEVATAAD